MNAKPIAYEAHNLARLQRGGYAGDVDTLRALAKRGEALRRRYENECSYEWANTPEYEARTEALEKGLLRDVKAAGLFGYLQTDCRGATLYVDTVEISRNAYSNAVCLTPAERGQ